jgi:hypothetical protein
MSILDRVRANGGDVIRTEWRFEIRRGKLADAALEWLRRPEIKSRLLCEVWPEYDAWVERAAIRQYDGGQSQVEAESGAYEEVMG